MTAPYSPIPVILESPYAGDVPLHLRYLRAAMRDCLCRGEAPFASHHQYTAPGVLNDEVPAERQLGIRSGFTWRVLAFRTVFYVDLGWSSGMHLAREAVASLGQSWEMRNLGPGWLEDQLQREVQGKSLMLWFRSVCSP